MSNEKEEKTFLCTYSLLRIFRTYASWLLVKINIILIFGNQFCSFQELLWLHFIVIIIIANQSIKGQSQYHNYYYDYYLSKRSLAGQAFIIITTILAYAYKFALQTKQSWGFVKCNMQISHQHKLLLLLLLLLIIIIIV